MSVKLWILLLVALKSTIYLRNLRKFLREYGLLGTLNPVSGKSLLHEKTKLEYHADGVLHGYWTSGGGASRHGIWILRWFFFGEWSPHTQLRERVFLLASEDNGSKWLPEGGIRVVCCDAMSRKGETFLEGKKATGWFSK
ncbi:hypothetical protein TNCV_3821831 [Trichonephila clavipes]|nr:hypothetical protein TNCV_3821831 [Trichonephila clavipes]